MTIAAENEIAHIGETQGAAHHDHDLVHELGKRLDALPVTAILTGMRWRTRPAPGGRCISD